MDEIVLWSKGHWITKVAVLQSKNSEIVFYTSYESIVIIWRLHNMKSDIGMEQTVYSMPEKDLINRSFSLVLFVVRKSS